MELGGDDEYQAVLSLCALGVLAKRDASDPRFPRDAEASMLRPDMSAVDVITDVYISQTLSRRALSPLTILL